jgi:hypothetical protein
MSTKEPRSALRQRVRAVTRQMWALHVGRGVAQTAVAALALVAAVAAIDYLVELPLPGTGHAVRGRPDRRGSARGAVGRSPRAEVGPEPGGGGSGGALPSPRSAAADRPGARFNRSADELARAGVAPALVAALEDETAEKAKPLPFQAALPVRPMLFAAGVSLLCVAVLVAAAANVLPSGGPPCAGRALSPESYTALSATSFRRHRR